MRIKELVVKEDKEDFSSKVEKMSGDIGISCYEVVCKLMLDNQWEPDYLASLLTNNLRLQIEQDARTLNLLKKSAKKVKTNKKKGEQKKDDRQAL